jgi:hypothetical protein
MRCWLDGKLLLLVLLVRQQQVFAATCLLQ